MKPPIEFLCHRDNTRRLGVPVLENRSPQVCTWLDSMGIHLPVHRPPGQRPPALPRGPPSSVLQKAGPTLSSKATCVCSLRSSHLRFRAGGGLGSHVRGPFPRRNPGDGFGCKEKALGHRVEPHSGWRGGGGWIRTTARGGGARVAWSRDSPTSSKCGIGEAMHFSPHSPCPPAAYGAEGAGVEIWNRLGLVPSMDLSCALWDPKA